jgi:death-on-curing protein
MGPEPSAWPAAADVLAIHEEIVAASDVTEPGVRAPGDVAYAVQAARSGPFGQGPDSLRDAAFQLLRLLVANHPFVDGNKRTALATTVAVYALHDRRLEYDRELKSTLKRLGTDETAVDGEGVAAYLAARATPDVAAPTAADPVDDRGVGAGDDGVGREWFRGVVRRDMDRHATIYRELARE